MTAYVPIVAEGHRFYTGWADASGDPRAVWVGPAPRLATPDGSTAYAANVTSIVPYVRFTSGLDLSKATAHVQYRTAGADPGDTVQLFMRTPGGFYYAFAEFPADLTGEWVTTSVTFPPSEDLDYLSAPGGEVELSIFGLGGAGESMDVSWLAISIGEKWLRGVQRNDGRSYTVPRGVQVSSVQGSLRGVGYQ